MAQEPEIEAQPELTPETPAPAPEGQPIAPAPAPMMTPDLMPGTGQAKTGGLRRTIPVKLWLILIMFIISFPICYGIYKLGHHYGYKSIFKSDINNYYGQNKYSGAIYPLIDIETNLSDKDYPKQILLSVHLVLDNDISLSECAMKEVQLRDALINFLATKSSLDINSVYERNKLKRLIRDEMNAILSHGRVQAVYFSKFKIKFLKFEKIIRSDELEGVIKLIFTGGKDG